MIIDASRFCIAPTATLREAMSLIDRNQRGIVVAVDTDQTLIGTITDGDVRRALLAGKSIDTPLSDLLATRTKSPICAPVTTDGAELLRTMQANRVRQLPLLDAQGRVVSVQTLDDLLPDRILPLRAVIMAGGEGTRLRPLTDDVPKSMLPVGDRPLMEHTVEQLRQSGIRQISVTTHYKSEKIREYFGDGSDFGVHVSYIDENQPLGTAGALTLLEPTADPMLVINGDIFSRIDFRSMLAYHVEHQADVTVAVRQFDLRLPYGVVETDGIRIAGITEKPLLRLFVNGGVYLLEPHVLQYLPAHQRFDMTDLLDVLIRAGRSVVSFPIIEYWLDIGRPEDYERARQDAQQGRME